MIQRHERKPYWRQTKWQLVSSLGPLLVAFLVIPQYASDLNGISFLGFPLGYFLVGPGLCVMGLFTIASFVDRQDAVDRWHGAHEDA